MSLVDHNSLASSKSELSLFTVPPTQVAVDRGFWEEIQLTNSVTNEGPYEFRLPPDPNMIHISKNYLYVVLRILKTDGTNIDPLAAAGKPTVGPINLLGKTFFNNIRVFIGGKLIYDSNNLYPYRAFLETELNFGTDARQSHLQAAMFFKDTEGHMEDNNNLGFLNRAGFFTNSSEVEMMAPIHCDLFMQEKYLLNNIDMRVELTRCKDSFALMSTDNNKAYKIDVRAIKWYVRKIDISKSIALGIESLLLKQPARYPIRRVHMTTIHVDAGRRSTPNTSLFSGQIPRRIIVGCVDSDAFHGAYNKNPFNFKHYSIISAKVMAGGQSYPSTPYQINISNGSYMRAYLGLFEALGMDGDNRGNQISRNGFIRGCMLLGFDLSPDSDDGNHWELIKEGTVSLHMEFADPIPPPGLEIIIYSEYDNLLTIDRNRMTTFDYSA